MKKRILSVLLLLPIVGMLACQPANSTTTPPREPKIYFCGDEGSPRIIEDNNTEADALFAVDSYKSPTAPATQTFTFLGNSYTLSYRNTYISSTSDIHTHGYSEVNSVEIRINTKTNEWKWIHDVPYQHTAVTEEEYLAECAKILGADYQNALSYQLRCETIFRQPTETGSMRAKVKQYFYELAEGETLYKRIFYFERCFNGIPSDENYEITFDEEEHTISVERNLYGYTAETFAKRATIDMEALIREYLTEHNVSGEELGEYRIEETMFVKYEAAHSFIKIYFSGYIVFLMVRH